MKRISGALCGSLLVLAAAGSVAAAQDSHGPAGRVPVTVAVTDSANFGQDIVILRRPDADPPNVIVMSRAAATPRHLAAAAATLSVIIQRDGDRPAAPGLYRVPADATGPVGAISAARRALATLEQRRAAPLGVAGVGPARTTRIYLADRATLDRLTREGRLQLRARQPGGGGR
jgi:hypothetical protein